MKTIYNQIKYIITKCVNSSLIINLISILIMWSFIIVYIFISMNRSYGQTTGDFRSLNNGNWATASSWETYNGSSWATASTYPGQNAGVYEATILAGDTISIPNTGITTNAMGKVTISGTLILNGGTTADDINFRINTSQIYITPGLTPYASITFLNKSALILPTDAIVRVWTAGLQGECNNHQSINIGSKVYAVCNGAPGDIFTFAELMAGGGTINSVIIPSATQICSGTTLTLSGSYLGAIANAPTYKWKSSGPQVLVFTPDSTTQNVTVTPTLNGTYLISLTVTTINEGTSYSNTDKFELTVYKKSAAPTSATSGKDTIMVSKSTTLTLAGGGGGENETIKWYSSSCGGTLVGTGNNITVSPTTTTTYYGRYEDATPCGNTSCVQTTIVVIPYANIWKGSLSTDFGTAGNWLDNKVPLTGENVTFDNNPDNDCILDMNRTIGDINNASVKNLNTSAYNLIIKGTTKFTGTGKINASTTGSVTYAGIVIQTLTSSNYSGNTIQNLIISNDKNVNLSGDLTISHLLNLSNGSLVINSNTLILNDSLKSTTGLLVGGTNSNLIINGTGTNITLPSINLKNLTLDRINGLTMGGSIQLFGILALTNGTLTVGANNLTLAGTSPSIENGVIDATHISSNIFFANEPPITLPNKTFSGSVNSIIMNSNGGITLSENLSISKDLQFNNGKIHTGSNALTFENTANDITGGNAYSYIDGFCKKIGNTAFTFAIGNSIVYAPLGISAANGVGNSSDYFVASYHGVDPHLTYDSTQHESTIAQISEVEYWILDRTGTNNVSVKLSWDARSGGVSLLSDLIVVRWDGTKWVNYGNTATTGNTSSGTITSDLVSNFSPFTLGSLRGSTNLLPITLSDFNVECKDNSPYISWTTSSELNNNYFEIEQSIDAIEWKTIYQAIGAGNSTTVKNYSYTGEYSSNTDYFYRLKSVDFDGRHHYSQILFLKSCSDNFTEFKIFPVPSKGIVNLKYSGDIDKISKMEVYNLIGERVFSNNGFLSAIDFSNHPNGTYYIIAYNGNNRVIEKFVISK